MKRHNLKHKLIVADIGFVKWEMFDKLFALMALRFAWFKWQQQKIGLKRNSWDEKR